MSRILILLPLILFAALAGVFVYLLVLKPELTGQQHDPSLLPSVLIDRPMPALELPPLYEGQPGLGTAELKGKPQLVNIFASWCTPCRIEHPVLMRLSKEEGIVVRGVAYKDKPEDSRRFLEQFGNPFTSIGIDQDGRAGIELGVTGVPETFVLDGQGRIRYRHQGPLGPAVVDKDILPLLRELSR